MGLEKPNEGDILVDGRSIFENTKNWQAIIGYIPQNIYLPYDYLYENIAFGIDKQNIKQEALTNSIKVAELDNLITNEHNNNEVYIGDQGSILSGGEKQRVAIARAIYLNPEVLIFDEPTSSLDTKTEENIIKTINKIKLNKTIIMVSHNKSALKYCDKIYKIENKKINLISK